MSKDRQFSDEFLHAFVDNQLTTEEKSQVYLELGPDQAPNRQVCELRKLHELVQLAYQDVPPPPCAQRSAGGKRTGYGIAASVLLALGIALGMQLGLPKMGNETATAVDNPATATPAAGVATGTAPHPASRRVASASPAAILADAEDAPISLYTPSPVAGRDTTSTSKVLIHITYNDPARVRQALDEVEELLHYYRDNRQHARVEIVVNGRGLDVLRRDTSRFAAKITRLQRDYDNLSFAACQNTIDRIKREQGVMVRLLPGVIVIDSGMAEIMRRQDQGWAYLQV
jgi:hypothetical protein